MIACDEATVWRRVQEDEDHASWERELLEGVRCEPARGASSAIPGDTVSDGLTLYVFADAPLSPGDMVVDRADGSDAPPRDAFSIRRIRRFTLGGSLHHLEAECR